MYLINMTGKHEIRLEGLVYTQPQVKENYQCYFWFILFFIQYFCMTI